MSYAVTLFIGILIGRLVFPLPLNSCRRVWGHDWKVVATAWHSKLSFWGDRLPASAHYRECRRCHARTCNRMLDVETDLEWVNGEKEGVPEKQQERVIPPKCGSGVTLPF